MNGGGHPAPDADKLSTRMTWFMLFGGPLAWFVELCGGVAMLDWPCFPMMDRLAEPFPHYGWTRAATVGLLVVTLTIALSAGFVSLAKLNEVRGEKEGSHADLIEIGHGRTRFTAMWGAILGFGFAIATLLTAIPLFLIARCAS